MRNILDRLAPKELWVKLPYNFDRKTMYAFIDNIIDENLEPRSQKISFDFSSSNFIDPVGVTVLSNLIEYLRKLKVKVKCVNHTLSSKSNKFLDDSGFFKTYTGTQVLPSASLRSTTLALQQVRFDRSHSWIHNIFSPWISAKIGLSEASFASIKTCLGEIFNNIHDHSGESVGCVFTQHYPLKKEVMLAISDFGVGIPYNVRKVMPGISDSRAIAQAVIEGFTTKSTLRNQGAGLDILTRSVVIKNRGSICVHSLKGSFQCFYEAGHARHLPREEKISYPGTLIQIKFNTDFLESVAEKEEFEW